jgi:uncharacterized membrane protein YqjE
MTEPNTSPNGGPRDVGSVPVGQLMSKVAEDLSQLMRSEVALAKVEVKEEVSRAGKAGAALGGAALAGWLTLLFASLALMYALDAVMPIGWAALIVAALWGVAAAVLAVMGRNRLRQVNPVPERTIETVKEDVQWLQNRTS